MKDENNVDELAGAVEADDIGDIGAARRKASQIISSQRETAANIAWAWVTLLDIDAGNDITPGEARYIKILSAQEEISKLGLLKTDEAGFPVRKYKGVPVSGMGDRGADIGMVAVSSVREAMLLAGAKWPNLQASAVLPSAQIIVNSTVDRHDLDHVIEKAIRLIRGRGDTPGKAAIWNELKEMALAGGKPFSGMAGNQLEYTDGNGKKVKYRRATLFKKLSPDRWRGTKF